MANEKVDAVIVGAGAAGAVFAAVLTRAGKKVVVLERGPDWKLSDLISSDIWARRIRPAGPQTVLAGKDLIGRASDHGWGTGGAALHHSANYPRLLPDDFTMKSDHGGLDWPISYADLAPYYDRAAREIGISGDAKAEERWRPPGEPYPMPPLRKFRHGEVWVKGFESVGIHVVSGAVGVSSVPYKGGEACIHDGWCGAGCPTGALANPQARLLGEARHNGAEVRPFAYATRVLTNTAGTRVTGVEYYDARKERQVQEASVVVLAAFASQNPRIMFNSATDKHPHGLSNASGLLGKYAMAQCSTKTSKTTWDRSAINTCRMTATRRRRARTRSARLSGIPARHRSRPTRAASPMSAPTCSARISTTFSRAPRAASPGSPPSARKCPTSRTAWTSRPRRMSSGSR
jgi:choline dehydrogenase-like flavoprotein